MEDNDSVGISLSPNDSLQFLRHYCPNLNVHRIGLLYSITSAICFGVESFLESFCGQRFGPLQILFEVGGVAAICAGISMLFQPGSTKLPKDEILYIILHTAAVVVAEVCNIYSLTSIMPSLTVVIISTSPVFISILAFVFLHEPVDLYDALVILITCAGAITVSVPTLLLAPSSSIRSTTIGISTAFLSAFAVAFYGCINRKIELTHPSLISFVAFATESCIAGLICFATGQFVINNELSYLVMILASGAFLASGHIVLARAYQLTVASYVNTANSMDTLIVMILQAIFLQGQLTSLPILGSVGILIGITLLGLKEYIFSVFRGLFHRQHNTLA